MELIGGRRELFPRVGPGVDVGDVLVGNAERRQVLVAGKAFGEAIAFELGTGGDEQRCETLAVELEGAIESSLQHRRRPAVVLRGAHHHDRRRGLAVVLARRVPHLHEGDHHIQRADGAPDERSPCARNATRHEDAPGAARPPSGQSSFARARRNRSSVRSRPKSSSAWNSGGPTVRPVIATRTGACALPGLIPCCSPTTSIALLQRVGVPLDRFVERDDAVEDATRHRPSSSSPTTARRAARRRGTRSRRARAPRRAASRASARAAPSPGRRRGRTVVGPRRVGAVSHGCAARDRTRRPGAHGCTRR